VVGGRVVDYGVIYRDVWWLTRERRSWQSVDTYVSDGDGDGGDDVTSALPATLHLPTPLPHLPLHTPPRPCHALLADIFRDSYSGVTVGGGVMAVNDIYLLATCTLFCNQMPSVLEQK